MTTPTPTRIIYLVRHTRYDNPRRIMHGRLPLELSTEGRADAQKLHDYFSDKSIQKIYSSAVRRCAQTAEIISAGAIPIEHDLRILETFSAYQGYWHEHDAGHDHWYEHRDELGGESFLDVQARVVAFFEDLLKKDEGNVILCSHGDPLYVLYLHLSSRPVPTEADEPGEGANPLYQLKGSVRRVLVFPDHIQAEQNFILP